MDSHDASATKPTPSFDALSEAMAQLSKTVHCPICMDYMTSPISLPCSHTYCQECIEEVIKNSSKNCPLCQTTFTTKSMSSVSKTLLPIVSSIKKFVACFEGKLDSDNSEEDTSLLVDRKFRMQRPDFKAGDLVHVAPRLWPGINKPGGAAWIQAVIETDELSRRNQRNVGNKEQEGVCYDCKYVLGGGVDFQVPAAYIRVANELHEQRESRSRRAQPSRTPITTTATVHTSSGKVKRPSPVHKSSRTSGSKRKKTVVDEVEAAESPDRMQDGNNSTSHDVDTNPTLVFLCSTLQSDDLSVVNDFCERFPPAVVHEAYSDAVTHVIVRVDRKGKGKNQVRILKNRTMKYLQGVIGHKWIVSFEWLRDCLDSKSLLNEALYEVTRDSKADATSFGPKWSREHLVSSSSSSSRHNNPHLSGPGSGADRVAGLFDVGCRYIFAGPFCHPGPTIDNLSFLLKTGGGHVLDSVAQVVTLVNASLDGGLRVRRKQSPRLDELIVVVVTSQDAANDFCQQIFMSISDIRRECAYDFGDFIDHLNGMFAVILSDWIFDCISNYRVSNPLETSRFRITLNRCEGSSVASAVS